MDAHSKTRDGYARFSFFGCFRRSEALWNPSQTRHETGMETCDRFSVPGFRYTERVLSVTYRDIVLIARYRATSQYDHGNRLIYRPVTDIRCDYVQ